MCIFFVQVQVPWPVLTMCRYAVCGVSDRQTVRRDKREVFIVHQRTGLRVDKSIIPKE